jgi:hypothetical protein
MSNNANPMPSRTAAIRNGGRNQSKNAHSSAPIVATANQVGGYDKIIRIK